MVPSFLGGGKPLYLLDWKTVESSAEPPAVFSRCARNNFRHPVDWPKIQPSLEWAINAYNP